MYAKHDVDKKGEMKIMKKIPYFTFHIEIIGVMQPQCWWDCSIGFKDDRLYNVN